MGHQTRRYWALGSASETAKMQNEAAEAVVAELDPSGEKIRQAGFINRLKGNDRTPSMETGMAVPKHLKDEMFAHARVGDDGVIVEGEHRNANGDRVITVYDKNGPRLNRRQVVEVQVGSRTFLVSHVRGGR